MGKELSINAHQPTQPKKRPSPNQYQDPANLLPPPFDALHSASPSADLQTYTRPPPHHTTHPLQVLYRTQTERASGVEVLLDFRPLLGPRAVRVPFAAPALPKPCIQDCATTCTFASSLRTATCYIQEVYSRLDGSQRMKTSRKIYEHPCDTQLT